MAGLLDLYQAHAYHRIRQQQEAERRQRLAMEAAERAREEQERSRAQWLKQHGPYEPDVFEQLLDRAYSTKRQQPKR